MSKSTTELLKDALELPEEQRVTLVIELLDSLNPVESGQGRTDAEWLAEVERSGTGRTSGDGWYVLGTGPSAGAGPSAQTVKPVRFAVEAVEELANAAFWYESRQPGLTVNS
jgi:hypothetical protein